LSLAGLLGDPYSTNPSLISFKTLDSGSVAVSGVISCTSSSAAPSVYKTATSKIGVSGGFSGFSLVGVTYTANNIDTNSDSSSSSSVNLPLILGISIPAGVVLIIVIIVLIVKLSKPTNTIR
jgi:hypothetical protein